MSERGPIDCPKCGRPSWNAARNPGLPCLPCKKAAVQPDPTTTPDDEERER